MEADKSSIDLFGVLNQFLNQLISDADLVTIWAVAIALVIACCTEMVALPFIYRLAIGPRMAVIVIGLSLIAAAAFIWLYLGYWWLTWLDYRASPSTISQPSTHLPILGHYSFGQLHQLLTMIITWIFGLIALVSLHMVWLFFRQGVRLLSARLRSALSKTSDRLLNSLLGNKTIDMHDP